MPNRDPINPTDDAARVLAQTLAAEARFGAIATTGDAAPMVSRVAVACIANAPHILVSTLSDHTQALTQHPACSILIGEPKTKGDPLTHPRMTIVARARQVDKAALKQAWLTLYPKSKLYFDFGDFLMLRLDPSTIHLNGGFGKAYRLTPADIWP